MKIFLERYGIAILVILGLLLQGFFYLIDKTKTGETIALIIAIIAIIPIFLNIVKSILRRSFGVDLIALVGIVTALFLGENTTALIILLMLSGGEVLESFALEKAQDGISHLIKINPTKATLVLGDDEKIVPTNEVKIGSIILVKQHEIIPLDGIVIRGESLVDESKLTGESVPVEKQKDSMVMSGSINNGGPLYIETTKTDVDSTYQNIIVLVKKAQEMKPNFIRIADRYAVWFTLIAFTIALGAYFMTGEWINALLVLVVATPCPLILAAPTAFAGSISVLAKNGVVVQNPDAIERLAKSDIFLFDKTGTLTYGTPKVHNIEIFDDQYTKEEFMKIIFSVEKYSTHILAESVSLYAKENKISSYEIKNFKEDLGNGVTGNTPNLEIKCGKWSFVDNNKNLTESPREEDSMYVYGSINGSLVGRISFLDEVRPEMKSFIMQLKEKVGDVLLVSGDKKSRALKIANTVGIDKVEADCSPGDKVKIVEKYLKQNKTVTMIGDGINDAPALARADVGIVLGTGNNNIATSNGSLVITGDNPSVILKALETTKKTMSITKQSIFVGMGLSIVLMFFGAFGKFSPVQGALMQEVIDIIVIVNALRVLRF
jgi:heavy metal translocating P-type ATPase